MPQQTIPDDLDQVLGALTKLLASAGNISGVKILANARASIHDTEYDGIDGGQTGYTIYLEIPQPLYHQLKGKQNEVEELFRSRSQEISRLYDHEWISGFVITT